MSSILPPLNAQLPAQAMQQSASAVTAYEQLRGIRQRRQDEGRQLMRQDLVRRLLGPAAQGDVRALEMLKVTDPNAFYGLAETQRKDQMAQMKQEKISGDIDRQDQLRRLRGMQNAIESLNNVHPANRQYYYDMLRARMETDGILEPGTLEETYSPEVAEDVRLQLQIGHDLLSNDEAMDSLSKEERSVASVLGKGTPEYKRFMKNAIDRDGMRLFIKNKIQRSPVLPPGVSLRKGFTGAISDSDEKIIKDRAESGLGVLLELKDLIEFTKEQGFKFGIKGVWAPAAQMLADQKITSIMNKIRVAERMGTLDKGAENLLKKMVPTDTTGFRQDTIQARLNELFKTYKREMAKNLRTYNADVDLGELTNGYLTGTTDDMLQYRAMTTEISPEDREPTSEELKRGGLRAAAPFIGKEIRRLRDAGYEESEARTAAAIKYGYEYKDGQYVKLQRNIPQGGTTGVQQQQQQQYRPDVQLGQEQPQGALPVGSDSPYAEQRQMYDVPLPEMTPEQIAANNEMEKLIRSGSPQEKYLAQPNELPPGPKEPEKQNEYFSDMYAQGHDRELIMKHYMGVWGTDGQGAIGKGKRRRPNLKVAPLPRLLTKGEQKEQADWERQIERLRQLSGAQQREFLKEKGQQFLQEKRKEFVESGDILRAQAPPASGPPKLTRGELRRLAIKRRQEAARRRYEAKLRGISGASDLSSSMRGADEAMGQSTWEGQRVNDILDPVMPRR
jgi:hypothetical protein